MGGSQRPDPERPLAGVVVLVVEDHPDGRDALRQLLEWYGAEVLDAEDGCEALRLLEAQVPDVIVSDLRMPRLDGFGLAGRVKHDVRWAAVPIVAVTALNSPADVRATREAGFAGHLAKPLDADALLATMKRVRRAA
jgi:CheY-like chemotaxis protein